MNKNMKCFIVVSVILNVLLLGVIIGQASHFLAPKFPPPHVEKVLEKLPADKQAELKTLMERLRKQEDATRDEVRRSREETLRILKTDPFDADAYQAQIDKIHTLRGDQHQRMADAVKELAKHWSADERALLGEALRRPKDGPPPPPAGNPAPPM